MSLYPSYFDCEPTEDGETFRVRHNVNGSLNFTAEDKVDEKTARLIALAINEGKRRRSHEIYTLLQCR